MKEIKIIKELTEKLKREGDISPEEADWIYMLREIYEAYCIKERMVCANNEEYHNFSRMKFDYFKDVIYFDFLESFLTPMLEAFKKWYGTACDLVSQGYTGNFVTTFAEKKTEELTNLAAKGLPLEVANDKNNADPHMDTLLTLDAILFQRHTNVDETSGSGLLSYPKIKINNVSFLQNMTRKLKKGEDITPEESDHIYMIVKFAQALYAKNRKFMSSEDNARKSPLVELQKELSRWYRAVYEAVCEGRKGNFLYTLLIENVGNIGPSTIRHIKKSLELLPEQFVLARFSKGCSMPNLAGVFSDRWHALYSERYGVVREAANIGSCVLFPDPYGISNRLEYIKSGVVNTDMISDRQKIKGFLVKVEYLDRKKIFPVCRLRKAGTKEFFIAYKKEDREKVSHVLEIPDEKVENMSPLVAWYPRSEEFLYVLEESVYALSILAERHSVVEEEDSWLEMIR